MLAMIGTKRMLVVALLGAAGCSGDTAGNNSMEPGSNLSAEIPEDSALIAEDPNLANEAAADEAADMETFGGNAAAMAGNRQ